MGLRMSFEPVIPKSDATACDASTAAAPRAAGRSDSDAVEGVLRSAMARRFSTRTRHAKPVCNYLDLTAQKRRSSLMDDSRLGAECPFTRSGDGAESPTCAAAVRPHPKGAGHLR